MIVQVCVGSSCHIRGSERIVELLQEAVSAHGYQGDITLAGSFCIGKCNRIGVTVQVDDTVVTGVTPEGFRDFFDTYIVKGVEAERALNHGGMS